MIIDINKTRKQIGQTSIELAILIIVVIGALLLAQIYFKRGLQGRWKSAVDEISDELYDPYLTDSNVAYRIQTNAFVELYTIDESSGSWTMRRDSTNSIDSRSGKKLIGGY